MTNNTKKLLLTFNFLPREQQLIVFSNTLEMLSMMAMMMGCPNGKDFGKICEGEFTVVEKLIANATTEIDKVEMEHLNKIWNIT